MAPSLNWTSPGKVTSAFLRDQSFVRGLRGPVGSGKSVACCIEIVRKAMQQKPNANGVRRSRWAVIRNCYDDQTDVLTERGYVRFADLRDDDRVAVLNRDGTFHYELPKEKVRFPVDEELYGFEGESIDFLVNGEHDLWASKRSGRAQAWGDYQRVNVCSAFGTQNVYRVRKDAVWHGRKVMPLALWRLVGLFYAEGYARPPQDGTGARLVVTTGPDVDDVRAVLRAAGVEFRETREGSVTRFHIGSKWAAKAGVYDLLVSKGKAANLRAPESVFAATPDEAWAFIEGYYIGDGDKGGRRARCITTNSAGMADDLQRLAIHAGASAHVSYRERVTHPPSSHGPHKATEHTVTMVSPSRQRPKLVKQKGKYRGWYRRHYRGELFCVTTSTGVINVRRNGKAFWCAQTAPELKTTTIKTWRDWVTDDWGKFRWSVPYTHHVNVALPDDTTVELEVLFLALDKPQDMKKLLSLELTGVWINEAREIDKQLVDACTMRVGRFPSQGDGGPSWYGVIMDTNSPAEDHWWGILAGEVPIPEHLTHEERKHLVKPEGWSFHTQPAAMVEEIDEAGDLLGYELNPEAENRLNLDPEYYPRIITGKSRAWINCYVLNRYETMVEGKPVYPTFRRETHVAKERMEPQPGLPIITGIDFGRTPAIVFTQQLPGGRWIILHELEADNMGATRFSELVKREIANLGWADRTFHHYGDPAGNAQPQTDDQTPFMILRTNGVHATPAPTNDPEVRIESVETLLNRMVDGKPALLVNPHCNTIIAGFEGGYHYRRLQTSAERYEDRPSKNRFSHPHDALQYAVVSGGEGRRVTTGRKTAPKPAKARVGWNPFGKRKERPGPI